MVLGDLVVERGRGRATATTKHRSKNSSSTVALRCSSSVARATIGRYHAPAGDPGGRAPSTWSAFMGR